MKERPAIAAIDVGGTFTDAVLWRDGKLSRCKLPTTPENPALGVAAALKRLGGSDLLVHGTTTATNALLEGKLAPIAFVTTKGMRDVLAIGRQNRDPRDLYAIVPRQRNELVPHQRRLEVDERLGPDGSVERPLSDGDLRRLAVQIATLKPAAVAVCLIHSYANAVHEHAVRDALKALGVPVVLSSDLAPEFREYERSLVTAANAGLIPLLQHYLETLTQSVSPTRVVIMHSAGGWLPAEIAAREPVRLALSGPAGGVVGVLAVLDAEGVDAAVGFDVGGTSTDVALVTKQPRLRGVTEVAGLPLRTPSLDIHTIGAGGGSLAYFDAGGALNVGPQSAGAQPGPACYARGGTQTTLTDALVVLGRLPASLKLGGEMTLDHALAEKAVASVGTRGSVSATAAAIKDVTLAGIARALKRVTVERGIDPRNLPLVPFGGAGGLLACELAELLGMREILVPRDPGLLCALGMLNSQASRDASRTVLLRDGTSGLHPALQRVATELEKRATAELRACGLNGPFETHASLDVRYVGQSYELNVPLTAHWRKTFDDAHKREFGEAMPDRAAEIVNVRARVSARRKPLRLPLELPRKGVAKPYERWKGVPVFDRDTMPVGAKLKGPAIVTELSSCLWLARGWKLAVLKTGTLRLSHA
ncbi:MAG: hydantoinase/oxoprolinase family protein [Planctomycetes bacterium]|nr:hydantoinase/oxoprolinase family protein [Planctomycetota bacterium]